MNKEKKRLHPHEKESFMEGTRQRWCAVFVAIGLLILSMNAYGLVKDPAPFLTFFTGIGVTFILGASASSVMAAYRVGSINETSNTTETKNITIVNEQVIKEYAEKYSDDPSYRPIKPEEANMEVFR